MNSSRTITTVLLLGAVVIAIIYFKKNSSTPASLPEAPPLAAEPSFALPSSTETAPVVIEQKSKPQKLSAPQDHIKDRIQNTPLISLQDYREDVAKNPHGTPPSFREAALRLGQLYRSIQNENEASEMMGFMKSCIDGDTPTSMRATCYRYAGQLSGAYPRLKSEYDSIRLDENTQRVVDLRKNGF